MGAPAAFRLSLEENGVSGKLGSVSHARLTKGSGFLPTRHPEGPPPARFPVLGLEGPEKEGIRRHGMRGR